MIPSFLLATTPEVHFGVGNLAYLPSLITRFGRKVLIVTGKSSFVSSTLWQTTQDLLNKKGISYQLYTIDKEPSPFMIDYCVSHYKDQILDVVVAIGGGSVLDAGKAISAMLPVQESVMHYLEGVGTKTHPGNKVPFIAVPTTAGTGSEATKNSVLSVIGEEGFKKSLRHNYFVPNIAIIDPELMIHCPKSITGSSGMDAFTQLLESFVSSQSNPACDALALEGLKRISNCLLPAFHNGREDLNARSGMALASYLSGVTLANAGLGLVHGFASSIGGFFDIPHGVVCSSMMYSCNRITVRKLFKDAESNGSLIKYSQVGKLFSQDQNKPDAFYIDSLIDLIGEWSSELEIPTLSTYGVSTKDILRIVQATENKNNPIAFSQEEMAEALTMSL